MGFKKSCEEASVLFKCSNDNLMKINANKCHLFVQTIPSK